MSPQSNTPSGTSPRNSIRIGVLLTKLKLLSVVERIRSCSLTSLPLSLLPDGFLPRPERSSVANDQSRLLYSFGFQKYCQLPVPRFTG
ncbi:MAG: hypothetical protein KFF73_15425 [Cyclobacteriaceae bacterium]|nr:hypothetical protein [Cyclobacteriaceae bacterium]